ncbi:MAG TPA: agmatine deiminase family protein [Candidatus Acidoferrales bacterium]|nr:agmatine deiminase family protein [Candidatus Acidoferrales bacterium]
MSPRKQSNSAIPETLKSLGYRMPAEWEPMAATWMVWPHNRTDWPGKFEPIPYVYAEIVRQLARVGRVELVVNDEAHEKRARTVLTFANVLPASKANIRFHRWPTNRGWTRDSGPIFVRNRRGEIAITNWRFNAWAKYRNWQKDNLLPEHVARLLKLPTYDPAVLTEDAVHHVVLEGGSIDVDGRGTMLTTEECLLSKVQQRNPGLEREDLEAVFDVLLGVKKVIWLDRGIVGDDTHGHVDDIARFVGPRTVLAAYEDDRADANHEILRENFRRLQRATDARGQQLNVIKLPMPSPVVINGQRVPASYANFYIFNGVVLVPTFNDANDLVALNTIAKAMPRHRIVPIYCGDLIWGLGAIHCMTQQQPR